MKILHSKTISAVCSFLLFATAILLLILLVTGTFNSAVKPSGDDMGENIGKACASAIVVVASLFAIIAQAIAGLLCIGSAISHKRKGSVYTSNAFCILFCVIASIVYVFTLLAFWEIANDGSVAKLVKLSLIGGFSADLFAIAACIIAMVVKGRELCKEEAVGGDEKLSSFIIGQTNQANEIGEVSQANEIGEVNEVCEANETNQTEEEV